MMMCVVFPLRDFGVTAFQTGTLLLFIITAFKNFVAAFQIFPFCFDFAPIFKIIVYYNFIIPSE